MNFVVNGTVAALVAILVQVLLKPLVEVWVKPAAPSHDTLIRAVALLLGIALLLVDSLIGGPWPVTGDAWLLLIGSGALSGASAVGIYHVLTGSSTGAATVSLEPNLDIPALAAELAPAIAALLPQVMVTTSATPTFTPSPLPIRAPDWPDAPAAPSAPKVAEPDGLESIKPLA